MHQLKFSRQEKAREEEPPLTPGIGRVSKMALLPILRTVEGVSILKTHQEDHGKTGVEDKGRTQ